MAERRGFFSISITSTVKKSNPAAGSHSSPQGCTLRPRKGAGQCSRWGLFCILATHLVDVPIPRNKRTSRSRSMVYTLRVRERDKETRTSKGDQCVDRKKDNWMKKGQNMPVWLTKWFWLSIFPEDPQGEKRHKRA